MLSPARVFSRIVAVAVVALVAVGAGGTSHAGPVEDVIFIVDDTRRNIQGSFDANPFKNSVHNFCHNNVGPGTHCIH